MIVYHAVKCRTAMLLPYLLLFCLAVQAVSADDGDDRVFHNHFAVKVDNATSRAVDEMASKHGFRNLGQIGTLEGYYLFEHERISKRSADPSVFHHGKLANEPGVSWVEQQFEQRRFKRDHGAGESKASNRTQRQIPGTEFPDPFYAEQWYLHGQDPRFVGFDMNVMPAWRKGYTGKGVVVSILDDGIQTNHPDLAQNYDPLASTDINGNDSDPMPRDDGDNKHGTRCAGEVAAVAFNSFCGVGIAYNAKIGGVRMLDGTVNDAVEASALSLNPNHIDIYSASWGPEDDGKTVDGPGPLAKRAFINGIMKGRKGKGSIFIWASGNGGRHEDSCNCDGYTNSIFTLSISSATQAGFKPWYLEECSSTLATTYSSGRPDVDRSIATVDMDGQMRKDFLCTSDHTGTSASAPLAAGICALALEANPNLTWRDMQHLVVFTSRPDPLRDTNWVTNGIGKKVSHKFGYGLMDAAAMVTTAEQWTNVPPQHVCQTPVDATERQIQNGFNQKLEVLVDTDACMGTPHEIRFLEHIQCRISLRFSPRGNLRIRLTSPKGTPTVLLFERPRDVLSSSFDDWPFMSVHFWGEPAAGRWKLEIINAGNKRVALPGILKKWQLVFYGTDTNPVRLTSTRLSDPPARPPLAASTAVTTGRQGFGRPAAPPAPLATPRPQQAVRPQQRFPFFFTPSAAQGSFRPSLFGSTRSTSFLGLASEQVTYVAPPDATPTATAPTPADRRSACPKYSIHGVCSETCPEAGYYAASSRRCEPCHAACSSCYGPGPDHCLRCADNFNAMVDKNLCAESCPESYHFEAATRSCVPCQAECVECDERLRCTRCQFRFILNDGRCHSTCPAGRYETDDYGCAECHPMCAECRGPGADQCVACASGTIQHLGHCLDRCPSASWHDPLQNQCLPCPLGCAACERGDSGADLVCTECAASWRLDASSRLCLNPSTNTCPQGEYAEEGKCRQCHGSCRECAGGAGEANCTRCPDGAWLDVEGRCRDACPAGTFAGDAESPASPARCRPCVATCAACQSSDRCTECVPGLHRQDGRCLTVCNEGYYSDRGVCVRCDASCASCSGPLATDCLRCTPGYALLQRHCLADCPVGTFNASAASVAPAADVEALADPHLCLVCQAQCLSCHSRSDRCLSCADGFAFNNKSCVSVSSLIEVPLVEFVKTAEGRGSRTGKDLSQHYVTAPTSGSYYWAVGLVAGVVGALIAVLAVFQAKSGPQQQRYTLVPLKRDQETGAGKVLLSPSDLDDEDDADGSVSTYKV